jgi:CRISPR-associated protein Cas2
MMQYSIYIKVINVVTKYKYELKAIRQKLPKEGNIRVLLITENQYNNISILRGSQNLNEKINNEERYIKI